MSDLKARIFSVYAVRYSARPLVNIQKATHSVTSAMEIVKSHLLGVNFVVFKKSQSMPARDAFVQKRQCSAPWSCWGSWRRQVLCGPLAPW